MLVKKSLTSTRRKQKKTQSTAKLTDQEWDQELEVFRAVLQDADATDDAVQAAWLRLRVSYSNKFPSIISPKSPSFMSVEPFSLWAAENMEQDILERALCIEFADQLANFNFVSMLKSTAVQAVRNDPCNDRRPVLANFTFSPSSACGILARSQELTSVNQGISIWHLILYFGPSMFSDHRLNILRKRITIFDLDSHGNWEFTQGYGRMLQYAASKRGVEINTIHIAGGGTSSITFTTPELSALASANPEFVREQQRNNGPNATSLGLTGIPYAKKKELTRVERSTQGQRLDQSPSVSAPQRRISPGTKLAAQSTEGQGQDEDLRNDPTPHTKAAGEPSRKREKREASRRSSSYGSTLGRVRNSDFAVPSIEGSEGPEDVGEMTTQSSVTLRNGKRVDLPYVPPAVEPGLKADPATTKSQAPSADRSGLLEIKSERSSAGDTIWCSAANPILPSTFPQSRAGSPDASPSSHVRGSSSGSKKRPIWESISEELSPNVAHPKRTKITLGQGGMLERTAHWNDDIILVILKQLEAIRPDEFIIVDGMKVYDDQVLPERLVQQDDKKGVILMPLKMDDGHRLLAVIYLVPLSHVDADGKHGSIQYYDSAGWNEDDGDQFKALTRVAQLMGLVLPNRDPDPDAWHHQHCVCPEQVVEGDDGPAICLAALSVVGSLPLPPPLPEEVDWNFWRHMILSSFLLEDSSVQLRFQHLRSQAVEKLIRQGHVTRLTPPCRRDGASDDEVEYLGHTVRDAQERINHRAINSRRIIEAVHQAARVFHNLTEHTDLGKASFKIQLDQSVLARVIKRKNSSTRFGTPFKNLSGRPKKEWLASEGAELEDMTASIQFLNKRLDDLDDACDCVRKATKELTEWRRQINEAVMDDDVSIKSAPKE